MPADLSRIVLSPFFAIHDLTSMSRTQYNFPCSLKASLGKGNGSRRYKHILFL